MLMIGVFVVICGAFCSTCGTLAIKRADNFRRLFPSLLAVMFYSGSTWLLSMAMFHMPVAIAHAAWSGLVALLLLGIDRYVLQTMMKSGQLIGFTSILSGIALLSAGL
ncbi:SMR family transporter [Aeromonas veronii]|uniref:DMT family transporter n=1 Tax=Aeromonas veronii TaxID=654 RepID=UPI00226CA162|nr:SMR family transporter [Aeromonas veronii]MCX9114727.1 SMR family transporter [Aeromonas veronii]